MLEVHVNFGSIDEARAIAREVVEKRLAACANIHAPIESFYWWEDELRSETETAVVFKTSDGQLEALMEFLEAAHSYVTPGIIVHRPMTANPSYLAWIDRETQTAPA
jgi:periplasmic divalent cation tolerance protein